MEEQWLVTSAGVTMPRIIYGTAWKKERTADLVEKAIVAGFRGIDTAGQPKHYNEAGIGEALQGLTRRGIHRDDLFLQTKFTPVSGQDPEKMPYDRSAPPGTQVAQSFERSLANLHTDHVDSLLLHSPLNTQPLTMQVWQAMESIQQSGGARQLGISNCYSLQILEALYQEARVKPAVVQNRFYQMSGYDQDLRHWCLDHNIVYQSFWTLTANPHILGSSTLLTLAKNMRKSPAQVFFRYLVQAGIVPLTGTTSEKHMQEDLAIFDFELSEEEVENIAVLLQS